MERSGAPNRVAWCPDAASRAGDGTECLQTGGPTRVWSNWGCAPQVHYGASWHPADRGTDFTRGGWSYDDYCYVWREDRFRFRSGSGTCRSVVPTPTPAAASPRVSASKKIW